MYRTIQEQLTNIKGLNANIIIDVAGKDSFAALIKFLEENKNTGLTILPIIVKSPTEFGSTEDFVNSFNKFKNAISNSFDVKFENTLFIEEPSLWRLLNGKSVADYIKRFDFYSPCPGCHIYFHSVRAYIAKHLGIDTIVSGERLSHGNKIKINQLQISIDYHADLLEKFGVNHVQPLLHINDTNEIDNLLNKYFNPDTISHYKCVFSSNYRNTDGTVDIPEKLNEYYEWITKLALEYFDIEYA